MCRVLVESFVSTQKVSVQKALVRKLHRYLSDKRDYVELMMSALQGLVRERLRGHSNVSRRYEDEQASTITISMQ